MGLPRLALLACSASTAVQPVAATSPAPLGRFGVWEAWSSPPMLAAVGQPTGKMAASISAYGKNVRWIVNVTAEGYTIVTLDGQCHEQTVLPVKGTSTSTVIVALKKQTEAARRCSRRVGLYPIERMDFSESNLREALLRVRPLVRPERRT